MRPRASIAFAAGSFGVLENRIFEIFSQTPRLPIAKATVKVTLVYIPVCSAGGDLHSHQTPSVGAPANAPQLRATQRLYMCQGKHFGMRLRRINRPKAAIITAKQRLLIMVEKCEAVER